MRSGFELGDPLRRVLNVRVPTCQPMPGPLPPGAVTTNCSVGVGAPMVTPREGCHAGRPLLPFSL
ncbi:hypothetical protein TorRG33x02_117560 [Trema orientale]|uniref:Uncharacterized protein n=1 Tax=Trema orientale TaxID=63057 RepID=A0A2P5F3T1_TREOI|nr:hypothetical protein TorRG33x02_117560 [Trema orientale]